jgi:transcription elongation factor GreA
MTKTKKTTVSSAPLKTKKKIFVTSKGLEEAKDELDFLKVTRRVQVAQRLQNAREYGDLSENSEYDAALEEQTMLENRIAELDNLLKQAQVIKNAPLADFVVIGSTVTVEMDGEVDEFTIVGRLEADPSKKRISNESPVGAALLGAKIGETVEVATPIVRYKCKVLEIK